MDIGDALRTRILARIEEPLSKYFDGSANGHVTVEREGHGYRTDCVLHLSSGTTFQSDARAGEAYASADAAVAHLEQRLRRYKHRLKDHHAQRQPRLAQPTAALAVIRPPSESEGADAARYHPAIIAEEQANLRDLSVGNAVLDLDMTGAPVLVFRHAGHGRVNIVYRRPDGNIGWVDPPAATAS